MHLHHHTDDELLALSRKGWDSAFAVLVHRHAPRLLDVASPHPDPVGVLVNAFSGAMRKIDTPVDNVGAWFDAQLASALPEGEPPTPGADASAAADDATIDAIWTQLRQRWPHGRRRRIPSHALSIAATIIVTIAISAAIPWFVLGGYGDQPTIQDLRAFIVEARDPSAEAAEIDEVDEPEEEPLPTFEFPVPPEDLEPAPADAGDDVNPESTTDEAGDDAASPDGTDSADSADGNGESDVNTEDPAPTSQ